MIPSDRVSSCWSNVDTAQAVHIEDVCKKYHIPLSDTYILVNITTQMLHVFTSQKWISSYAISTGKNGVGQKEGSGQTPIGLHYVAEKIGDGAGPFEVFKARVSTGEIAQADTKERRITGRILWLQGAEPGFNLGKDAEAHVVDSHDRYIYIHGTNDVANIGKPVSAGCICLKPDDVIALFAKVTDGTSVYIYDGSSYV